MAVRADGDGVDRAHTAPRRVSRPLLVLLVLSAVPVVFLVVTSFTGFPGPGTLRRYPLRDLQRVADEANARNARNRAASCAASPDESGIGVGRATVNPLSGRIEASHLAEPPPADELAMFDPPPGWFDVSACDVG